MIMKTKLIAAAVLLMSSSAAFAATPGAARVAQACCEALACCGLGLGCC
jgi:hypothetical protein